MTAINTLPYYSPQRQDHIFDEYYGGAYGQDGAPASKFIHPLTPAHYSITTHQPNIAPAEVALPPSVRFSPTRGSRSPSPSTSLERHQPGMRSGGKLPAPKAAFLECSSPTSPSFGSGFSIGRIHGEPEKQRVNNHREYLSGMPWKDLAREKEQGSSNWLRKQSQAGSKFKTVLWIIGVAASVIICLLVGKAIARKSTLTSAKPLSWANGASTQPTFGANSTNKTASSL
ncbi:hypothetical protein O181_020857 [Austropuccinia psidii MF-1]|uniref:Uncharacterized protein n=1 Tax=Austropuccinia psidii MF-1 TaxID=1389203 RepID=A0A9Q3CEC1_9BASI|nr:hypothetical protein [Austropuccinia psidii MF-1]